MNETDDPLTDQDKLNLCAWSDKFYDKGNLLLDFPYAPSLGHYEPDLLFTDEEDPAGQPGPHWDGTQTAFDIQEPPTEADRQLYPIWGYCFAFILLAGSVAFLWAFFGYCVPWFIRVYVEMAGIS